MNPSDPGRSCWQAAELLRSIARPFRADPVSDTADGPGFTELGVPFKGDLSQGHGRFVD